VDLFTFLGSAVLALSMLLLGLPLGLVHSDMPDWLWVGTILLIDAAHVYATGFRVYFDRHELSKRPWLYALTPLVSFALAWFVYREGSAVFWRVLDGFIWKRRVNRYFERETSTAVPSLSANPVAPSER
jgi:hypothetical protein